MYYPLKISTTDSGDVTGSSRDIPECVYLAKSAKEAQDKAAVMMPGTLELFYRRKRRAIPLPSPLKDGEVPIFVPVRVQAKILLWNTMCALGIKVSDLAQKLEVKPTQAQRLVDLSKDRASMEALENALAFLGYSFTLHTDKNETATN